MSLIVASSRVSLSTIGDYHFDHSRRDDGDALLNSRERGRKDGGRREVEGGFKSRVNRKPRGQQVSRLIQGCWNDRSFIIIATPPSRLK